MKHYLSALLAATLLASLTACGESTQTAPPSASPSPTQSAVSLTVPDVAGKKFQDTQNSVLKEFKVTFVGSDGQKWKSYYPDETVGIMSTEPAAGTVTDKRDLLVKLDVTEDDMEKRDEEARAAAQKKADAAEAAAKLATRYEFTCGGSWGSNSSGPDTYHSLKEVWASPHYAGSDTCSVAIDGQGIYDHPVLNRSEKKIAAIATNAGGGGGGSLESDFVIILQLCTKLDADYADEVVGRMDWKKNAAKGALALCPNAPHAAVLRDVATAVKTGDGTHIVGKNMEPGTYKTKPGAKDCYWSRTTGDGSIIANDFVGFAPDGVTVIVYPGEGFESQFCGTWTKIG